MPLYENAESMANEVIMLDKIAKKWGWDYTRLPIEFRVEAVFQDPDLRFLTTAYAEVKRRYNPIGQYPLGYMIDREKIEHGLRYALADAVPFILWVWFDDGHKWLDVTKLSMGALTLGVGGRWDRGDPNDYDEVYYIPIELFKKESER